MNEHVLACYFATLLFAVCYNNNNNNNNRDVTAVQTTEAVVMNVIRTFPAGSSGGPDGIRPQHVLDLVSCRESGPALLAAITGFVNGLLDGRCSPVVAPILFGGQLVAL